MHIQSINNSNLNFNGSYCFKGPWTDIMRETTVPFLKELANGDKQIIAKMKTKRAFFDRYHHFGEKLYKPTLFAKDEKMTLWQKIKEKLGFTYFPEANITDHYHRASSIETMLKRRLNKDSYTLNNYRLNLKLKG